MNRPKKPFIRRGPKTVGAHEKNIELKERLAWNAAHMINGISRMPKDKQKALLEFLAKNKVVSKKDIKTVKGREILITVLLFKATSMHLDYALSGNLFPGEAPLHAMSPLEEAIKLKKWRHLLRVLKKAEEMGLFP